MADVIFNGFEAFVGIPTSKSIATGHSVASVQRAPTDPFFYADVDIENAVVGSAYILGYDVGGDFVALSGFSGTVTTATFTLENVPSYTSPMLLRLRLRKGTSGTKYIPFELYATHSPNGVNMYCSQIPDPIA